MTHLGKITAFILFFFYSASSYSGQGDLPNETVPDSNKKFQFAEKLQNIENDLESQRRQELSEKLEAQNRIHRMKACFQNDQIEYHKILKKIRLLLRPVQKKSHSPGGLERLARAGVRLNKLLKIHTQIDCESPIKQIKLAKLLASIEEDLVSLQNAKVGSHDLISRDQLIDELGLTSLDPKVIQIIRAVKDRKLTFKTYGFNVGAGPFGGVGIGASAGIAQTAYGDTYPALVPQGLFDGIMGVQLSVGKYSFKDRNFGLGFYGSKEDMDSFAFFVGGTRINERENGAKISEVTVVCGFAMCKRIGMMGIKLFPIKRSTSAFLKNLDITWENIKLEIREPELN